MDSQSFQSSYIEFNQSFSDGWYTARTNVVAHSQNWAWGIGGTGLQDEKVDVSADGHYDWSTHQWIQDDFEDDAGTCSAAWKIRYLDFFGMILDTYGDPNPEYDGSIPFVLVECGFEHCDVTTNGPNGFSENNLGVCDIEKNYQRQAQTTQTLFVGGRGIPGEQVLVDITGWAHDIENPWAQNHFFSTGETSGAHCEYQPIWDLPSMPYENIVMGGLGRLFPDGHRWELLPSGAQYDATPSVPGDKSYTAKGNAQQYIAHITANGHDLDLEQPDFCVGQAHQQ